MQHERAAGAVMYHAIQVATRGALLAESLEPLIVELRNGRSLPPSVQLVALEGQQEFIRLASEHATHIGAMAIEASQAVSETVEREVRARVAIIVAEEVARVVAEERARRAALPWWRRAFA